MNPCIRNTALASLLLFTSACSATDDPIHPRVADFISSGVDRPEIRMTIAAEPRLVSGGDTVRLIARAYNSSSRRIQIGIKCGPALDVLIRTPTGRVISALDAMSGPNAMFTCELSPFHFVEPRDSLIHRMWWVAPARSGKYMAVAGARGRGYHNAHNLDEVSSAVSVVVR
jgi:hypothetical protein